MALVTICSSKGAPGVTSTALALATAWPHPATLVEVDPTGGDLALRCQTTAGADMAPRPSLLDLAADVNVREGYDADAVLTKASQTLASGVLAVRGVNAPAQAAGLSNLWPRLVECLRTAHGDVIADVGRLQSAPKAFIAAADRLVVVGSPTLEGVMHLRETLRELQAHSEVTAKIQPVLVGEAKHAEADCSDLDKVLTSGGVHVEQARHIAWDPATLQRMQTSNQPGGKKPAKSPLLMSAKALAEALAEAHEPSAAASPWVAAAGKRAAVPAGETGGLS